MERLDLTGNIGRNGDKEFLVEYDHGGETWCVSGVYAEDITEATAKVAAIGRSGRVLGEIKAKGRLGFGREWPMMLLIFLLGALAGVLVALDA